MPLEFVGHYLQQETYVRTAPLERDGLGRSSFNRYYYAAFLEARKALFALNEDWKALGHATIPDVLRGAVVKQFNSARSKARRIDDSQTIAACTTAISAAKNLADVLEAGYATRVVADYRDDLPISFKIPTDYSLNSVPISSARHWPAKARGLALAIIAANRQSHVFS